MSPPLSVHHCSPAWSFVARGARVVSASAILYNLDVPFGYYPGQAEMALVVVGDPVCAADEVGRLGTIWRLCHVLTDGHS